MLNYVVKKIKSHLNLNQETAKMDQAIARMAKAQHVTLLRTDYLE